MTRKNENPELGTWDNMAYGLGVDMAIDAAEGKGRNDRKYEIFKNALSARCKFEYWFGRGYASVNIT